MHIYIQLIDMERDTEGQTGHYADQVRTYHFLEIKLISEEKNN